LSAGNSPPKPPPKSRIGLTDVERAISVLDGRHPEHEKAARQTREAAEKRRTELEVELARSARSRRTRRVVTAVLVVAAAGAAVVAAKVARRANELHEALGAAEADWIARGFAPLASNELTAGRTLEADVSGSSCYVALSTTEGPVRAMYPGGSVVGPRSVGWCSCAAGRATVETTPGGDAGLAVLQIQAATLGGPLARAWLDFAPGAWGDGGRECADTPLDAWLATRHPAPGDTLWLKSQQALLAAGLKVVATLDATHPFTAVDIAPGSCNLALASTPAPLSLRLPGGSRPVKGAGAIAWCGTQGGTASLWREGMGPAAMLSVPATRIGGLLGLRELAESAGLALPAPSTWLRPGDRAWDATVLLQASGATDVVSAPLRVDPEAPDPRVVALSLAPEAAAISEPAGVVIACDPPLAQAAGATVCAHSAPVSWFNRSDAAAGAARGSLPVWLTILEGHRELDAVARIPEILALTRRLAREGFEPTALEAVTELPDGVRVTGRAGEDAVVALGLVPKPPWVLPYTDGIPWDLGDAPREVPLKPGDSVKLATSPPPDAPLATRRTVVFRRVAR
jgi:hypothetical protein